MKKIVSFLLILCMCTSSMSVYAKNGDILTYSKATDIVAYINHYAIESYNINGITCVGAEDLGNFGFTVEWNPDNRSLYIARNPWVNEITQYSIPYETDPKTLGMDTIPVLETDITTYVNGMPATSYNIGGKTVVEFDSLATFGKVEWNPDFRALKLWVEDGLEMLTYMQSLKKLPTKTLYSADGRSISVLESEVNDYLNVGWYASKSEATAVQQKAANQKAVQKFYVGQSVMQNLFVLCKYGVVDAIDANSGKIKVYWTEIQDAYGNKQKGMEGMLYGLNSSVWVDAADVTPLR